ncbi:MAG TPA: guanitoxin biosynthesis heme-dependent pre-guanitoxin N-hydroxylase GntA [Allosphingosinicella sp.]|nr:guanitoxin biosynthesis heme-dependent pre-guanitoxin N-hydroxylase GntA [Allosphingosinicella sp.]
MHVDEGTALALEAELSAAIGHAEFPCLGAKSALARGMVRTVACRSIESAWDDVRIHEELLKWSAAYRKDPIGLRSLAIVFEGPDHLDEEQFETAMWKRLQSLADKDVWRGQPYDRNVSANTDDPLFSLSFGGAAFFVVGLHPQASRPARRLSRPTLVFNLHDQFDRLRGNGRYEGMRAKILKRDAALAGTVNPMLVRHGEASEARQYSGRVVSADWLCPFRDPRAA